MTTDTTYNTILLIGFKKIRFATESIALFSGHDRNKKF